MRVVGEYCFVVDEVNSYVVEGEPLIVVGGLVTWEREKMRD